MTQTWNPNYNPRKFSPARGGHAQGHLRDWIWSYLEPEESSGDIDGRPSLWALTGLLWNCTDMIGSGYGEVLARWRREPRCPCPEEVSTFGQLARTVRVHLARREGR
jgi:hypothetical protein